MFKVIKESEGKLRKVADGKTAINLLTKDISPNVSLAITEAKDYYEQELTEYNRIYYVLTGVLTLIVEGQDYVLQPGDSCFISKGTTYEMKGHLMLLL